MDRTNQLIPFFDNGIHDGNLCPIPIPSSTVHLPFGPIFDQEYHVNNGPLLSDDDPFLSANIQFDDSEIFGSDNMHWFAQEENDLFSTLNETKMEIDFGEFNQGASTLTLGLPSVEIKPENINNKMEVMPMLQAVGMGNEDYIMLQQTDGTATMPEISPETSEEETPEEHSIPIVTVKKETPEDWEQQNMLLDVDQNVLHRDPVGISAIKQETDDKNTTMSEMSTPTVAEPEKKKQGRGRPKKTKSETPRPVEGRQRGGAKRKKRDLSTSDSTTTEIAFEKLVKIRPAQVKSQRKTVPDDQKDDEYYAKRLKNTIAAKRCRESKKQLDAIRVATRDGLLRQVEALRARKEELERLTVNYEKDLQEYELYRKLVDQLVKQENEKRDSGKTD